MIRKQALSSSSMSEKLQTVFLAVATVVNSVKNSPMTGKLFAKLCDDVVKFLRG